VENLASHIGNLRWHILYPNQLGADALRAVRSDWLHSAKPLGAVWTIEHSKKTNALHCNIITPAGSLHEPANAHHWTQLVQGNPRHVGAYIGKRHQMPSTDDYTGRLWGTAGQIWNLLANQKHDPLVAAAAAQYAIDSHAMLSHAASLTLTESEKNRRKWHTEEIAAEKAKQKTPEEYREIAARWIPDLLDFKRRNAPKP